MGTPSWPLGITRLGNTGKWWLIVVVLFSIDDPPTFPANLPVVVWSKCGLHDCHSPATPMKIGKQIGWVLAGWRHDQFIQPLWYIMCHDVRILKYTIIIFAFNYSTNKTLAAENIMLELIFSYLLWLLAVSTSYFISSTSSDRLLENKHIPFYFHFRLKWVAILNL